MDRPLGIVARSRVVGRRLVSLPQIGGGEPAHWFDGENAFGNAVQDEYRFAVFVVAGHQPANFFRLHFYRFIWPLTGDLHGVGVGVGGGGGGIAFRILGQQQACFLQFGGGAHDGIDIILLAGVALFD